MIEKTRRGRCSDHVYGQWHRDQERSDGLHVCIVVRQCHDD